MDKVLNCNCDRGFVTFLDMTGKLETNVADAAIIAVANTLTTWMLQPRIVF